MPLTPEQIAEMDKITGFGQPPEDKEVLFAKMDEALSQAPAMERKKASKSASAAMGFADMTSFGLDDELRGVGRAIGNKLRGKPMTIDEGIDSLRGEHEVAETENPGSYLSGQIAGAVLPAFTPGGQAIFARIGAGGLKQSIAKGAASGAASGGLYGIGSEEGDLVDRLPAGARGAAVGAVAGGVAPAAFHGIAKLNTKTVVPNSDEIKKAASAMYQKADELGGKFKPEFTNQFLNRARQALLTDDDLINAMKSNKPLADAFDDLAVFQNQPMTLQRAQALDEQISNMIDGTVDAQGNISKAGKKLLDAQSAFRSMVETADEGLTEGGRAGFDALKEGRGLWATSRRLADIERIIENAETYQVPATAIKTGFRRLLNSSKTLGYTPEEIKALKGAAETGMLTDVMATFGNRLGALVGASHGPAGAALGYGASTAARAGATTSQTARANKAAELVAKRSGMVKTEKRIDPEKFKALFRLPPKQAKSAIDEQKLLPPPQSKALPAPAKDFVANRTGEIRQATAPEQSENILKRQNAEALGMTPDVARNLDQKLRQELMQKYGQSEIGKMIAENPNLPLARLDETSLQNIQREIMKLPPGEAKPLLELFKKAVN